MKLAFFAILLSLIHFVNSIALDFTKFGLHFPSTINIQNLRKMRLKSQLELESLMPANVNEKVEASESDTIDQLLLLPRDLLKTDIFAKLGLEYLNQDSHLFNLTNTYQDIVIPKDSKNLFIFNTTDRIRIPKKSKEDFVEFLDRSAPFNLPKYMNLVNYYAVIPKAYIESKANSDSLFNIDSVYSNGVLEVATLKLPIFRKCISENKPMMVFLFNSGESDEFYESSNAIMNIKNYLPKDHETTITSGFFDSFAYNWIEKIDYDSLVQSVFCTTSTANMNESYCLKVQDSQSIHLFPAFFNVERQSKSKYPNSSLRKRDNQYDAKEHLIKLQAFNQVVSAAQLLNETTYKSNADQRLDIHANSNIDQDQDSSDEAPERPTKLQRINDRILHKVDYIKNLRDSLKRPIKEETDNNNVERFEIYGHSFPSSRIRKLRNGLAPGNNKEISAMSRQPEGGFLLPASLIRHVSSDIETPRKRTYAQVIFTQIDNNEDNDDEDAAEYYEETDDDEYVDFRKRLTIFANDENCDKITWYSIFHYSIFGKPHFCLD